MRFHLTRKSANAKTGPMPVSTSSRARADRRIIIGFPAHGSQKRIASAVAERSE